MIILPRAPASTRRALGIIGRPDQLGMFIHILIYFFFLPNVISRSEDIDSRRQQFVGALQIHSYAARGVLGISNRQIDSFSLDQRRNQISNGSSRRPADDVSKNQNTHRESLYFA